jgi:hypothetical protein
MPWRKISTCAGQFIGFERHPVGVVRHQRAFVLGVGNLVRDDEHVLAILAPVAGLLPLARVHHLRGLDLFVACAIDRAAHIGFQLAPHEVALGMPENGAVRLLLEVEQVHLRAQLAVVALGGFLKAGEVGVELFLVEPAGAVDARELGVLLVAAPVSAGNAHQLERLRVELAGGGEMRAAAHVVPVGAAAIDRQLLALRQLRRPFCLEGLARSAPLRDQGIPRHHLAGKRLVRRDDLAHLHLDRRAGRPR